ncbi:MAG: DUF1553 domain-containing protein, partial [Armatimonadota bacterium]
MKHHSLTATLLVALVLAAAAFAEGVAPYEAATWPIPANAVDTPVLALLQKQKLELRPPCSDEVFLRRVFIDVIGTLPQPKEVTAFLQDARPDKRAALIEGLLARDEFVDYQTLKWCDLLRVKSEFPINLWPNAVQAYNRWVHDSIRDKKPYDQFARELLTSSGSNFRVAPVNFYRAMQGRDATAIARAVALTFMGVRLDGWPEARRAEMANLFSRVAYKKTGEWKEEIVYCDASATTPLKVTFPDGTTAMISARQDPREAFADWLLAPGNKWFAQALANRTWYWLMGRGIIHEPDDIRPDNPAACPELLALLSKELVNSKYDTRQLFRLILNSRTYQQSSLTTTDPATDKARFAHYTIRRLDAEVLVDALCWLGGNGEEYSSPIPEPFTFIPKSERTIALADGSITSQFLETFGRPSRDTGLESERNNTPSDSQRLYLLNSTAIQKKIENSQRLRELLQGVKGKPPELVRRVYMNLLSRP